MTALLAAEGLVRHYRRPRVRLRGPAPVVEALRGVSLSVADGESVGVVGESGSGKSTLVRLLLALDTPAAGRVTYRGAEIVAQKPETLATLRREVQVVFQDPVSSLDPRMRVRTIIGEPLRALRIEGDHEARVAELLDAVGLNRHAADRYPHEFSGGQRQRVAIARALAPRPRVLVADEPVSALDVSVRAQILNLIAELREALGLALVLVSHDLAVVRHTCDRVVVMHAGEVVEEGRTDEVFAAPQHPYTRALLSSILTLPGRGRR